MKLFDKKPKDERVVAETNRIYKAGYMILTFGILVDLYLQFSSVNGSGFSVRPVEFGMFMLAQIACVVMMVRRGMSDDNRYAEADVFPQKYYALVSLGAGAGAALLFLALRMLAFPNWEFGAKAFVIVMGVCFLGIMLSAALGIYVLQYFVFCMAKRRRAKMDEDDDTSL